MNPTILTHHPQAAGGTDPGLLALIAVALVLAAWALAAGLWTRHRRRPGPPPHARRP